MLLRSIDFKFHYEFIPWNADDISKRNLNYINHLVLCLSQATFKLVYEDWDSSDVVLEDQNLEYLVSCGHGNKNELTSFGFAASNRRWRAFPHWGKIDYDWLVSQAQSLPEAVQALNFIKKTASDGRFHVVVEVFTHIEPKYCF